MPSQHHTDSKPPFSLAICMLASGSKGNAIYISNAETAVLIDAGLSGIEIERRLAAVDLSCRALSAIIVSHEHDDHIQGVGVLARRFKLPVYISPKTEAAARARLGAIGDMRYFECGSAFEIDSLKVHPFSTSHDAADPAGFVIRHAGRKIGIATDLGIGTAMVKQHLKGCDVLVVEANHDPLMLAQGPYPWPVKQRIKSRTGHLSNQDLEAILDEVGHAALKHVILAHLSETNNHPQKALKIIRQCLNHTNACCHVALQDKAGELIYIQ